MGFDEIKPLENADFYLDLAFRRANSKANEKSLRRTSKLDRIKTLELVKIQTVRDTLVSKLDSIASTFPPEKDLTEFYKKLISTTFGVANLERTLRNIMWTSAKVNDLFKEYDRKMKNSKDMRGIQNFKKEFYGRVSSLFKKLKPEFKFLRDARGVLQSFPVIRQKLKQVAIAGFPNVGKSTLLGKLSNSRAEIASYAFTTKKTMIGYIEKDGKKIIQLLDTPGTLNRLNKMNYIEQQAYFIMKLVAEKIVYIFDLTEEYPIEDQEKLYRRVKDFGKPVIVYLSKTDILDKKKVVKFEKKYDCIKDIKELNKLLLG